MNKSASSFILIAATAVFVGGFAGMAQGPGGTPASIPPDAKIELVADRTEFFLGENVLLHYLITNTGGTNISVSVGGDYRGGNRAGRFKVTATDAGGRRIEDPFPNQADMGGLSPGGELKPGEAWYESVPVLRYLRLDSPGDYQVEVCHDLGWGDRKENDPRVRSLRLTFREPDEAAAKKVVADMIAARSYSGDSWGKKGRAGADFSLLTHPIYLPLMEQQGDSDAVTALSHMPTTDATRSLFRLAGSPDDPTAALAGLAVSARIPPADGSSGPPRLGSPSGPRGNPPTAPNAWPADASRESRALAHWLLKRTNDLAQVAAAAILMQVGDGSDLQMLLDALEPLAERALGPVTKTDHHEGPRWTLRQATMAFEQFAARGITLPNAPKSPPEYLAYMARVAAAPNSLEPGYETVMVAALEHPHPVVREAAIRRLPDPLPTSVAPHVIARIADSDPTVRGAACEFVNNRKLPGGRSEALRAIASSEDNWTVWMAVDVAVRDGGRVECARLLADRFASLSDDPQYVGMHIMGHLCRITTGGHMSGSWHFLREPGGRKRARAIRDAWKHTIDEHAHELRADQLVKFGENGFPAGLIPPGVEYSPPR